MKWTYCLETTKHGVNKYMDHFHLQFQLVAQRNVASHSWNYAKTVTMLFRYADKHLICPDIKPILAYNTITPLYGYNNETSKGDVHLCGRFHIRSDNIDRRTFDISWYINIPNGYNLNMTVLYLDLHCILHSDGL